MVLKEQGQETSRYIQKQCGQSESSLAAEATTVLLSTKSPEPILQQVLYMCLTDKQQMMNKLKEQKSTWKGWTHYFKGKHQYFVAFGGCAQLIISVDHERNWKTELQCCIQKKTTICTNYTRSPKQMRDYPLGFHICSKTPDFCYSKSTEGPASAVVIASVGPGLTVLFTGGTGHSREESVRRHTSISTK